MDLTSIVTLVVTAIVALFSAYLGVRISANATLKATSEAFRLNAAFQANQQTQTVRGFLLAIRAEIKTLWDVYELEFGHEIQNLQENESFEYIYPVYSANYFAVFEANAGLLGQLSDDKLRELIIKTYIQGRTIINTHLYNNQLIQERNELMKFRSQMTGITVGVDFQIESLNEELKDYSQNLKSNFSEMKNLKESLIREVDNHVMQLAGDTQDSKLLKS